MQKQGIRENSPDQIREDQDREDHSGRKYRLLAEQAYLLLQQQKMKGVDKVKLAEKIEALSPEGTRSISTASWIAHVIRGFAIYLILTNIFRQKRYFLNVEYLLTVSNSL